MIVTSVQHVVDKMRDDTRTRIYRTLVDPVTRKEQHECEMYTIRGVMEVINRKGTHIDKKV